MGKEIEGGGERISGDRGADWDALKKVPFAGFGSQERQRLHEEGRIKDTGAYVLNEKLEVVGLVPPLPEKYEKTNMKYEKTIGDELDFLQNYLDDKEEFLKSEDEKTVAGDFAEAYDARQEQRAKLRQEVEYVGGLLRYFRTADEAARTDLTKGDVVFEKIRSDIAKAGDEMKRHEADLKEAGAEVDDEELAEIAAQRKARQRVFRALRAKFEHGARFEGVDGEFVPIYDESEDDGSVEPVSDSGDEFEQEQVLEPTGAASGYSRGDSRRNSRENETFNWWMPGSDEVQEAEQRRNRRFEEEKRRREAQEEQEMEQEEELGMEM